MDMHTRQELGKKLVGEHVHANLGQLVSELLELETGFVGESLNMSYVDADGDFIEAMEFWLVSDWLGMKLQERGEIVTLDWYGLTVWGRACSGQAIKMDDVIQQIAMELPNAY